MTDSTWSAPPVLGLVPLFHLDPAPDGPPLASPDGHWWWNGERWVTRPGFDSEPVPGSSPAA